ncbi:MAG: tryptophan 2,3-dioxygenase, partial [Sphingopyxis sp.]
MLDKTDIHARLEAPVLKDYGVYLAVDRLLACQKPLGQLVTPDELQFQIVHQVEDLWMKLAAFTLADIDQNLREGRI